MPDHVHLLLKGERDDADLRACAALCKQKSVYAYSQEMKRRLWQPSFYDRVLRDDETDLFVIAYILLNPVRAGLVRRCVDYPFLGSTTMCVSRLIEELRMLPAAAWRPVSQP